MRLHLARLGGLFLLCLGLAWPAWAQPADVARSKDHPLLTRYPNSHIVEYARNFNGADFAVARGADGNPTRKRVEGDMTDILYFHNDVDRQPSALQLIRNYQNAIKGIGGEVVYERLPKDGDGGETTLRVNAGGKEVWVLVEPGIFSAPTQSYKLTVVEVAAMLRGHGQQRIDADRVGRELAEQIAVLARALQGGGAALLAGGHAGLAADGQRPVARQRLVLDRFQQHLPLAVGAGGADDQRAQSSIPRCAGTPAL